MQLITTAVLLPFLFSTLTLASSIDTSQPAATITPSHSDMIKPAYPQPTPFQEQEQEQHFNDLELRQAIAPVQPAASVPPAATQQSPITTYLIRGPNGQQTPIPYTQLFSPFPDQWPSPTPGTIGLGTIQGEVGVVKTKTKRDAAPTGIVGVKDSVERLMKRKTKPKTGSGSSNAAVPGAGVSSGAVAAAVAAGIGMAMAVL